jgi:cyanophycin synthetase
MFSNLHTNQKLLVSELQKRGAEIKIIDMDDELLEVTFNGRKEYLLDRFSSMAPFHMVKISADKHLAKKILHSNGVQVPEGEIFTGHNTEDALNYAKQLFPVVLKPNWGSHGDYVEADIQNRQELEIAIWKFVAQRGINTAFIIEKYVEGDEHRLFVTAFGGFAVVKREPSMVIGNGIDTILKLAEAETEKRREIKSQQFSPLCPIVIDEDVNKFLVKKGIAQGLQYVPAQDEKVFLRNQSNLAKGGLAIDLTDDAHSTVKKIAFKALKAFPGLPCVGLDLICKDISKPLNEYAIIEANSSPGLAMHMFPSIGQPRDVAAMIADVMFPYIKL